MSLWICLLWIFRINRIIHRLSVLRLASSSQHGVFQVQPVHQVHVSVLFLFHGWVLSRCMNGPHFVYSFIISLPTDGPLGCFHLLAIVTGAVVVVFVQLSESISSNLPGIYLYTYILHIYIYTHTHIYVCMLSVFSLWDPMNYSPTGSSVHDSPGKNSGVGCHALLHGIFLIQGSNPCLLSPALTGGFFTTSATWGAHTHTHTHTYIQVELLSSMLILCLSYWGIARLFSTATTRF